MIAMIIIPLVILFAIISLTPLLVTSELQDMLVVER